MQKGIHHGAGYMAEHRPEQFFQNSGGKPVIKGEFHPARRIAQGDKTPLAPQVGKWTFQQFQRHADRPLFPVFRRKMLPYPAEIHMQPRRGLLLCLFQHVHSTAPRQKIRIMTDVIDEIEQLIRRKLGERCSLNRRCQLPTLFPASDPYRVLRMSIIQNKKAFHDYFIEQRFEAGLALEGWEVKAIRAGRAQLKEAYVTVKNGELWLLGCHISPLSTASTHIQPDPTRTRKLLMHAAEISRLIGSVERAGYTLLPLDLHYAKGRIKAEIGLAKGKKQHDKRADEKEKEWRREQQRLLRAKH